MEECNEFSKILDCIIKKLEESIQLSLTCKDHTNLQTTLLETLVSVAWYVLFIKRYVNVIKP